MAWTYLVHAVLTFQYNSGLAPASSLEMLPWTALFSIPFWTVAFFPRNTSSGPSCARRAVLFVLIFPTILGPFIFIKSIVELVLTQNFTIVPLIIGFVTCVCGYIFLIVFRLEKVPVNSRPAE
jgi:hypothetical protein